MDSWVATGQIWIRIFWHMGHTLGLKPMQNKDRMLHHYVWIMQEGHQQQIQNPECLYKTRFCRNKSRTTPDVFSLLTLLGPLGPGQECGPGPVQTGSEPLLGQQGTQGQAHERIIGDRLLVMAYSVVTKISTVSDPNRICMSNVFLSCP